jgi:threonine dehydratase
LSSELDCKLHLKMENLQRTGAYKDRGAMNAVLNLDDAHKKAGVTAASAGNHAQGLAFAAQHNKVHATIVMPESAPIAKVLGTERFGAEVVLRRWIRRCTSNARRSFRRKKATHSFTLSMTRW